MDGFSFWVREREPAPEAKPTPTTAPKVVVATRAAPFRPAIGDVAFLRNAGAVTKDKTGAAING